jgi:hypothetical protein
LISLNHYFFFQVSGHLIEWANWSFRLGFNWREGLVLYLISWNENGRKRPILYRASLAEVDKPFTKFISISSIFHFSFSHSFFQFWKNFTLHYSLMKWIDNTSLNSNFFL